MAGRDAPLTLVSHVVVAALIIDADESARFAIENTLAPHGFVFRRSEDAPDAMHQACDVPPDIIFLRVELPSASGFSIFNKLKRHGTTRSIPIIMYASDVSNDVFERHKGLKTHADEYLRLPVDEGLLINAVHGLVEFSEQQPTSNESLEVELSTIEGGLEENIELDDIELVSEFALEEEAIAIGQDHQPSSQAKLKSYDRNLQSQSVHTGQSGSVAPEFQAISQATDDAFDALTLVDDDEMPLEVTEAEAVATYDTSEIAEASEINPEAKDPNAQTKPPVRLEPLLFQETEEIETSLDELTFEAPPADSNSSQEQIRLQQDVEYAQKRDAVTDPSALESLPSAEAPPESERSAVPSPVVDSESNLALKTKQKPEADPEQELELDLELTSDEELNIELEPQVQPELDREIASKTTGDSSPIVRDDDISTKPEQDSAKATNEGNLSDRPDHSTAHSQPTKKQSTEENAGFSSRREVLQFKSQLVQKDREILALREEIESAERQVLDEKHKNRELHTKMSELQGSKLKIEEQLLSAQEQSDAATRDKSTILKREEGLKTRLEASQKKCRALEAENNQSQQAIAQAEQAATQRVQELEQEKLEFQQQVESLQLQVNETSEELKHTTNLADERNQELEVMKSQLSEMKESIGTLESNLKQSKQESENDLKNAEEKLTSHQQKFEESKRQLIEEHQNSIEQIRGENQGVLEELQSEKKQAEEKAQSTIEDQAQTIIEIKGQLENLQQEARSQTELIAKAQSDLEGYRDRLATIESDLEDTQSNFARVSQQLADRENAVSRAHQALTGALQILEESRK